MKYYTVELTEIRTMKIMIEAHDTEEVYNKVSYLYESDNPVLDELNNPNSFYDGRTDILAESEEKPTNGEEIF